MRFSFLHLLIVVAVISACNSSEDGKGSFASRIEAAHQKESFLAEQAIEFNILLTFNGNTRLDGKMTLLTNSTKGKITEKNGVELYYDNDHVFINPKSDLDESNARFKAYTWSYFFLMPFKLTDPGTKWEDYPKKKLGDEDYAVEKLTFENGTGDAPDDWYIVYQDTESGLMHTAAYIVTAKKSVEEAEADPHAIVYANYEEINGIPIATSWRFHNWDEATGLGEQLGQAELSNMQFIKTEEDFFKAPTGFIER